MHHFVKQKSILRPQTLSATAETQVSAWASASITKSYSPCFDRIVACRITSLARFITIEIKTRQIVRGDMFDIVPKY